MRDIDAEALGILIGKDCDPLTAVAGSIIDRPKVQRPGTRSRLSLLLGIVLGPAGAVWQWLPTWW